MNTRALAFGVMVLIVLGLAAYGVRRALHVPTGPRQVSAPDGAGAARDTGPGIQPESPATPVTAATVRDNRLHDVHLGDMIKAACADCHDVAASQFSTPDRAKCQQCHQGKTSTVHASAAQSEAGECTACHPFAVIGSAVVRACQSCHGAQDGAAPRVEVHGQEQCTDCHRPHATPSLQVRACASCHADQDARHGARASTSRGTPAARSAGQPAGQEVGLCLDCHGPHERASAAVDRCQSCHKGKAGAVFAGHDRCVECHAPHDFSASKARACRECHGNRPTLAAARVSSHAACTSCHAPHASRALRQSCQRCHQAVIASGMASGMASHPGIDTGRGCISCHPAHAAGNDAAVACSSCHAASSDVAFHKGNVACTSCHVPHAFAPAAAVSCQSCHKTQAKAATAGHGQCQSCHRPHQPGAAPPACATCHPGQARTAPRGHATCTACHDEHSGARGKKSACATCHTDRTGGPHGRESCQTCHRAHGPGGRAAPPACASCHAPARLPALHTLAGHKDCQSCHRAHGGPRRDRALCLSCHRDRIDHEPRASSCVGCHRFGGGS